MIEILFLDGEIMELRAEGHAGAGEFGRDLVCAGVSALIETAAENLRIMGDGAEIRLEPGSAVLRCPGDWEERVLFRHLLAGLRMLAREAPEHILVREAGPRPGKTGAGEGSPKMREVPA